MYFIKKKIVLWSLFIYVSSLTPLFSDSKMINDHECLSMEATQKLSVIQNNRHDAELVASLIPIIHCSLEPSHYENTLLSRLRDKNSSTILFRDTTHKLAALLVNKVFDCLPTSKIIVETPLSFCEGEQLNQKVDLVSIMRSGDALVDVFLTHFSDANVSKLLVQRDEATAKPFFHYMKLSPSIASGNTVVITEPMIATGGTLVMVIEMLKSKGVKENDIVVAAILAAPEGLLKLSEKFPEIKVVFSTLDEKLNEKKYIVPGLGDFGDRFFGSN